MPTTVYQRLAAFYEQNSVTPLSLLDKPFLGRRIIASWLGSGNPKLDHQAKILSFEDTGTYKVVVYPDSFAQEIDRIIFEWYYPPQKKVRNRKPVKPTLEISVKPSKPMQNG